MVSAVIVRSAGSYALAAAGPRRFGGGRLPAAAAPGLLADGAGWGLGIRASGLDSLRRPGNLLLATGASAWALKAAAGGTPSGAPGDEKKEDSELVQYFKVILELNTFIPAPTDPSSAEYPGSEYQLVIGGVADRCFDLWVEVANRLRPPSESDMHKHLQWCGDIFVCAKVRKGAVSWTRAMQLAEGLQFLRRIVSSAILAPLPPPTMAMYAGVVHLEYGSEVSLCLFLKRTCRAVEDDIHSMFTPN